MNEPIILCNIILRAWFGSHPFLRWWGVGVFSILESWRAVAASQQTFFYCLRLPFKLILGKVTKKCRGLHLGPLEISRIGKTPTPHHRKNAALPSKNLDFLRNYKMDAPSLKGGINDSFLHIPLILLFLATFLMSHVPGLILDIMQVGELCETV